MPKEHIPAGSRVNPGTYRCNACANSFECTEEGQELPICQACSSISWRTHQLKPGANEKSHGKA